MPGHGITLELPPDKTSRRTSLRYYAPTHPTWPERETPRTQLCPSALATHWWPPIFSTTQSLAKGVPFLIPDSTAPPGETRTWMWLPFTAYSAPGARRSFVLGQDA